MTPSEGEREQFREVGFFVTERMFDDELLGRIASDFERLRAEQDAAIRESGGRQGISLEGRNFIAAIDEKSVAGRELCTDAGLVEMAIGLMGPDLRLYWNQAVTKAARSGASFAWHQDSGYHPIEPVEYLTVWIPLEDSTVDNGTIWVLSGSHRDGLQEHILDEQTGDKVGYQGDEEGLPVAVPKGSAAVFSSLCLHRSGPNTSAKPRRAYVVQFAPTDAVDPNTGERWGGLLEVSRDGRVLAG
ncbi:MAG TPA: phytanoyl-CoA dioxygenase family protein [Chloroflexota bacterium]|nr:phytanoyl-CoA dioxygenase family protein [Chloroflexota bacterium]